MRDIKFRAWNKEKNIMCYENEDFDADYWDGVYASILEIINDNIKAKRYIFMQYTGLKDENGKEIYEGDIISNGCEKCIVVWVKEYAGFMLKLINKEYKDKEWTNPIIDLRKGDEVIGNVWEDSDLLNDSKNTKSN